MIKSPEQLETKNEDASPTQNVQSRYVSGAEGVTNPTDTDLIAFTIGDKEFVCPKKDFKFTQIIKNESSYNQTLFYDTLNPPKLNEKNLTEKSHFKKLHKSPKSKIKEKAMSRNTHGSFSNSVSKRLLKRISKYASNSGKIKNIIAGMSKSPNRAASVNSSTINKNTKRELFKNQKGLTTTKRFSEVDLSRDTSTRSNLRKLEEGRFVKFRIKKSESPLPHLHSKPMSPFKQLNLPDEKAFSSIQELPSFYDKTPVGTQQEIQNFYDEGDNQFPSRITHSKCSTAAKPIPITAGLSERLLDNISDSEMDNSPSRDLLDKKTRAKVIQSRNSKIKQKNLKQYQKFHEVDGELTSSRAFKAPSLSVSYISSKNSERRIKKRKNTEFATLPPSEEKGPPARQITQKATFNDSKANKALIIRRKKKHRENTNPLNFHGEEVINRVIKINGASGSVDLTKKLKKHKVLNTIKSLIKARHTHTDSIINQNDKETATRQVSAENFNLGVVGEDNFIPKSAPVAHKQSGNEKEIQTDMNLYTLNVLETIQTLHIKSEENASNTLRGYYPSEGIYASAKSLGTLKSKDFKIVTTFECTTVFEQNLQEAIDEALKDTTAQPCENFNFDIERKNSQEFIEDVMGLYSIDALHDTDEKAKLEKRDDYKMQDVIMDFNTKAFYYQNDMKNPLTFMTDYDTQEVEYLKGELSLKKHQSEQTSLPNLGIITRVASAPINSLYKLKLNDSEECSDNYLDLSLDKNSLKEVPRLQICGSIYTIDELAVIQKFGSITMNQTRGKAKASGMTELLKTPKVEEKEQPNIYEHMRTGLKQRRIQINRRIRKISVDRESLFNKLLNTQKSIKEDQENQIHEEDEEYKESSRLLAEQKDLGYAEEDQTEGLTEDQAQLDAFLLGTGRESSVSPLSMPNKSPNKERHFFATEKLSDKQIQKRELGHRRSSSNTCFNNNKFSMVVKIDNDMKDKKELQEFHKSLKNTIVTSDDLKEVIVPRSMQS